MLDDALADEDVVAVEALEVTLVVPFELEGEEDPVPPVALVPGPLPPIDVDADVTSPLPVLPPLPAEVPLFEQPRTNDAAASHAACEKRFIFVPSKVATAVRNACAAPFRARRASTSGSACLRRPFHPRGAGLSSPISSRGRAKRAQCAASQVALRRKAPAVHSDARRSATHVRPELFLARGYPELGSGLSATVRRASMRPSAARLGYDGAMRSLGQGLLVTLAFSVLVSCTGGSKGSGGSGTAATGSGTSTSTGLAMCPAGSGLAVDHVIVVVQENHTFDTYFGKWCTAPTGSNPTCTMGPACCEAGPATDPSGAPPVALDDVQNGDYDPNHAQACEVSEIDGGKMDKFVAGATCSNAGNFAYATDDVVKPYHDLAAANAIADRYFQPIAGQSSSNDMYLAVAKEVFIDNAFEPSAPGAQCEFAPMMSFTGSTIADLLLGAGKTFAWYSEGWSSVQTSDPMCPSAPMDCPLKLPTYPCIFDPGDVPFLYYSQFEGSNPSIMRDYTQLAKDLDGGTLPDVSYVKAIGYRSEHPGVSDTISAGETFVTGLVKAVDASCYKDSTLVLVTWDEGGGFFDHVAPPPESTVDNQPYGTRLPLLAIGPYAAVGTVSHVTMEHSSIVKFLEYNFLGGKTGQLSARDAVVNNIGSLLDPSKTKAAVPTQ